MLGKRLLLIAPFLFAVSCSSITKSRNSYTGFSSRKDYRQTTEVFRDKKLLAKAAPENSVIKVDLSDQRALLLVNNEVALDAPCCTGKPGKATPKGKFVVKEKIRDKRSNIFGSLYRGGDKVHGGDRRKYGGSYDSFVGASLPYWMRLTDDGIGIHGSAAVHRSPRSNGCVRMPDAAIADLYAKVSPGTPVVVAQ